MERFWDESIWCPPGLKWKDFRHDSAQLDHLFFAVMTSGILFLTRHILEVLIFLPLGRILCKRKQEKKRKSATNEAQPIKNLNSKTSKTVIKFAEGMSRLTFYTCISIYGWFFVLWDKPYAKDTLEALKNYPHHPVQDEEWWYYNIELGYYLSLLVSQFFDTKRKDFWQMFVHHIVTILLLVFSWACNFHRMGALVLAIHDIADVPLEGAKLAKYSNKQRLADCIFAIFTITWIYTRCYLLPTRVIYYSTYEALSILPFFPAYYIFNGLLCLLQVLHLAWTWLIMCMVYDALKNDGMRDLRSDSETSEDSFENSPNSESLLDSQGSDKLHHD